MRPLEITAAELPRLRWRCRRGMKELDQLLVAYLETHLMQASLAQQQAFLQLLETEDDRLWKWVVGLERPADANLRQLLETLTTRLAP